MEDQFLKSFVEKVTTIQQERKQKPFSPEELKAIAESLGMNQHDWQAVEETFQAHLVRGTGFLSHQNWEDAIQELEQAWVLQRTNDLVLYGLAIAYAHRWREYRRTNDLQKAFDFIKNLLQHHPKHEQAIELQSQLRKEEKTYRQQKSQQRRITIIAFGIVFLVVIVMFLELFYPSKTPKESSQNTTPPIEKSVPKNNTETANKPKEIVEKPHPPTPVTSTVEEDDSKKIAVEWVENSLSEGITLTADKALLEVYDNAFSLIAAVRVMPVNQEVSMMKLKYQWLDAKNQVLFEKTEEVISSYAATIRPNDCAVARHLIYQDGKKPPVAKLRCSVAQIEKQPSPSLYEPSPSVDFEWIGRKPANVDLHIAERLSSFNPMAILKELHHKLHLEVLNTGNLSLKRLKLTVEWYDTNDNLLNTQDMYVAMSDLPVFRPQERRVSSTLVVFKQKQVGDIKAYKVKVTEVSF